jgi:multidrug resistance efflux pump
MQARLAMRENPDVGMIKSIRKRARPDNLKNQVRAGGKSLARRLYLFALGGVGIILVSSLVGPLLFLDADGLVMRDRSIISPDYNARVTALHVKPGDQVSAGQELISVVSSETLDRIADLTAKVATLSTRETQLFSRINQIETMGPALRERRRRSAASLRDIQSLASRQLTTAARVNEATRELYEADREEAQLTGEIQVIKKELEATINSKNDIAMALEAMKKAYNSGRITAPIDGMIGPKTPSLGSIIRVGEAAVDIYHGQSYVIGYLPTSRLFAVAVNDGVVINDGKLRSSGKILRVEAVADALPAEFQSVFSSRERQQVIRVQMEQKHQNEFPVHAKVKVTGYFTPTNITSMVKTSVAFVTNGILRIGDHLPGFGGVQTAEK